MKKFSEQIVCLIYPQQDLVADLTAALVFRLNGHESSRTSLEKKN